MFQKMYLREQQALAHKCFIINATSEVRYIKLLPIALYMINFFLKIHLNSKHIVIFTSMHYI